MVTMKPHGYAAITVTHGMIWSVQAYLRMKSPMNAFVKTVMCLLETLFSNLHSDWMETAVSELIVPLSDITSCPFLYCYCS